MLSKLNEIAFGARTSVPSSSLKLLAPWPGLFSFRFSDLLRTKIRAPVSAAILTGSLLFGLDVHAATGSVAAWGGGQSGFPGGLNSVTVITTAMDHSAVLNANGTVTCWGYNFDGQTAVPGGLNNVIAVSSGDFFSIALRSDGSIIGWGSNDYGQCSPPAISGVTQISAGHGHCLARKSDGTVVAWGSDAFGQTEVPAGLSGVSAVLAAWNYSLALKSDGTVVGWGLNDVGQINVPGGLNGVVALAGNQTYCLALKNNGTIVAWGSYPALPGGLNNVVGIAAGVTHALAVKSDGSVVAWGSNFAGETIVPESLGGAAAVAAGWNYSLALVGNSTTLAVLLTNPRWSGNNFNVSFQSQNGKLYALEYKNAVTDSGWTGLVPVGGNGGVMTLSDTSANVPKRVYRVRAQ